MACHVGEIADILERWAPVHTIEEGDNVGLLAGISSRVIDSVLISLDVDENVIQYPKYIGAGVIIAHHPFIYRKISSISDNTQTGRLAINAIEAGIAIYASHTNLDRALGGVNDSLCEAVGLNNARQAEEGCIGRIADIIPASLESFALHAKDALGAPVVRLTGHKEKPISRIYVISGAGRHDISIAARLGADCMLTGEIGYHDGQDALGSGLCVVEAGHYYSEKPILKQIEKHLQSKFQQLQYTVRTAVYEKTTCPFYYLG
jgi:dinuclear metal center YbgI/SA1388 family protein